MKKRIFHWNGVRLMMLLVPAAMLLLAGCSSQFLRPYDLNNLCFAYDMVSGSDGEYVVITRHIVSQSDVVIPDTIYDLPVREVGESVFAGDPSVQSVTFGKNVRAIGANAFGGCASLKTISFSVSASDIAIGDYAFTGCAALEKVALPDSVTAVGRGAFYDCAALAELSLPEGLSDVGGRAFAGTPWLAAQQKEFVTVGDGVLIAYNGKGGNVKLPKTVKSIAGAFAGNTGITDVKLHSKTVCIGDMAFKGCTALETVTVPDNLEAVGRDAFYGCTKLKWVILKEKVGSVGEGAFDHCGATVYVEQGSPAEQYCIDHKMEYCIL